MRLFSFRPLLAFCALAAAFVLIAADADARSRVSFGSRGSKTFSAPPPTQTAPTPARPMERTMTQPGQPGGNVAARPSPAPAAAPTGGLFGRPGFFGGLAAGFLGAGLIGLMLGHGFGGGLGGFASILGLLLQVGLVAIVGYMLWSWWQRRQQQAQPAFAGGPSLREAAPSQPYMSGAGGGGGGSGVAPAGGPSGPSSGADEIGITGADFDTFERLLGEVQTAYGAEDLGALRARLTPEMLSYFSEDLAANTSSGVVNRISNVKLLQGDLAESWREGNIEYATVALRYSLIDEMVERASGRVTEGGPDEATEVWTFMRSRGGSWLLSAIQQV